MLLKGEPWKEKKPQQKAKDDICELMAQKILNGKITVDRYMDRMIEIMGNYDNWEFKKLSFVFTNIHLPSVNVHKNAFSLNIMFFFTFLSRFLDIRHVSFEVIRPKGELF